MVKHPLDFLIFCQKVYFIQKIYGSISSKA